MKEGSGKPAHLRSLPRAFAVWSHNEENKRKLQTQFWCQKSCVFKEVIINHTYLAVNTGYKSSMEAKWTFLICFMSHQTYFITIFLAQQIDFFYSRSDQLFNWISTVQCHSRQGWIFLSCSRKLFQVWQTYWILTQQNYKWASSWDYGTYHIGDQRWLGWAYASAQSHQSLHCSHTWSIKVDEGSDQTSDF